MNAPIGRSAEDPVRLVRPRRRERPNPVLATGFGRSLFPIGSPSANEEAGGPREVELTIGRIRRNLVAFLAEELKPMRWQDSEPASRRLRRSAITDVVVFAMVIVLTTVDPGWQRVAPVSGVGS